MISLIGVASLGARRERIQRLARPLVAFAAGALLGDAFFHLVPEALTPILTRNGPGERHAGTGVDR
jgi:hypothetical protein